MYLSAKSDTDTCRNPDSYVMANGFVLKIERVYVTAPGETKETSIRLQCRRLKAVSAYCIERSGGFRFESSSIGVYRLSKLLQVEEGFREYGTHYLATNPPETILISDITSKYVVNAFHKGQMVGHPLIDSQ